MKAIIYDYYGVYPEDVTDFRFTYGGENYFIFFTDFEKEEIAQLDVVNQEVYKIFNERVCRIVKNKEKQLLTSSPQGKFVLVTIKPLQVELTDLMLLHFSFMNKSQMRFKLSDIAAIWEQRFDFIEKEAANSLRTDAGEYNLLLETLFFGYGLAENALGYIADIIEDYGDKNVNPTLTHIRLPSLDPLVFFNPLNFYFDHSCRDLTLLYMNDIIDIYQLSALLKEYHYNNVDAALLMARVLFPSMLFDLFEEIYLKNESRHQILKYHGSINEELQKLKSLHLMLIEDYHIRPIGWLINHQ